MEGLRVKPTEVASLRERGHKVYVLDARSPAAWEESDVEIPLSIRMTADEIPSRLEEMPSDRQAEIVAYCT